MRAVLQRVTSASVAVGGDVVGRIESGVVALVGVERGDDQADVDYIVEKITRLRLFDDETGRMGRSLMDVGGEALLVSQFTLQGDCRRGRRPSYDAAADPDDARARYEAVVAGVSARGIPVATGRFRETMSVALVNEGPVTILLDSRRRF